MGVIGEIEQIAGFYAHARAIEHEAAVRCREFAEHAREAGAEETATIFATLAGRHARSLDALGPEILSRVPILHGHGWLLEPSEQGDQSNIVRLMTPYQLLHVALNAEQEARAVLVQLQAGIIDPDVRQVALRLVYEKDAHIAMLERGLSLAAAPIDWERDFGRVPASLG